MQFFTPQIKEDRMKKFIALLSVFMLLVSPLAFGSVGVEEEGTKLGAATDINFVGVGITATGSYSKKTITLAGTAEEIDTYTVLTVAESGTTFVATGTSASGVASRTFRLPDITSTNDGVFYTFITGISLGVAVPDMILDPGEHDTIALGPGVGDGVSIGGTYEDSYPSIKLVAFGGNWYIQELKPVQDGGSWYNNG